MTRSELRHNKTGLRCRFGWHRWSVIPADIRARALKAGVTDHPNWYVGRQTRPYCTRCGASS